MLIQVLLGDQTPVANGALVLRLVMSVLLVRVKTVAVSARFPAHVADHRSLPVIQPRVRRQVALDFELLAAVLAREAVMLRVLSHEVGPQRLLPRADQPTDYAGELPFAVELRLLGSFVVLSQVGDHGGPLVAPEVARDAGESFLGLGE